MEQAHDRRIHPRYELRPMYTGISVRKLDHELFDQKGHAYDISIGGIQFELDEIIEPGTPVEMLIELPFIPGCNELGTTRSVLVGATVVWIDTEEPGPIRMAAVFNGFADSTALDKLTQYLNTSDKRAA